MGAVMRPVVLNAPVGDGIDVTNDGNSDAQSDTENGRGDVNGNGGGGGSGGSGGGGSGALSFEAASTLLRSCVSVCVVDDDRTGEVVLLHKDSGTLIMSDLLYKSNPTIVGPGGSANSYSTPKWFGESGHEHNSALPHLCFDSARPTPAPTPSAPIHPQPRNSQTSWPSAEGQQELFYAHPQDNSSGLLPSYRTHPRVRSIDMEGMRTSVDLVLSWKFDHALACHTDPMEGDEARGLIQAAWAWC